MYIVWHKMGLVIEFKWGDPHQADGFVWHIYHFDRTLPQCAVWPNFIRTIGSRSVLGYLIVLGDLIPAIVLTSY